MKVLLTAFLTVFLSLPAMADTRLDNGMAILRKYCVDGHGSLNCRRNGNGTYDFGGCTDGFIDGADQNAFKQEMTEFCNETSSPATAGNAQTQQTQNTGASDTADATVMKITGTVVDEKGTPISWANVVALSDNKIGTATNNNGIFSIDKFPTNSKVKISAINYKEQTLSPKSNMGKITMEEEAQELEEVIVSGNTTKECTPGKGEKEVVKDYINQKCYAVQCESERYKLVETKTAYRKLKVISFEKNETICDGNDCTQITVGKCQDQNGRECKPDAPNAKTGKYKWENNKLVCLIDKCNDSFLPNDTKTACEKSEGPCTDAQVKAIEHATKGELKKGVCHATECEPGYDARDGKCIAIGGNCNPMPENAKSAHREFNAEQKQEICVIDDCDDGYKVSDDKLSCVAIPQQPKLSKEDSEEKINKLRENAQAMKDKEQSTENKLIGAAGIGATGIGGMQMASAMAEQNADADAEEDMKAYLATFKCDFGQGQNIKGGEANIELPGGNQLLPLYTEYTQLASDLKVRKTALGLKAGIESETILDKATTGLYDNAALGKTSGAYTSLARALSDETSTDAAAWAAQKSETASKLKTGATVAGIGAVGSLIANVAVNSGDKKKNKSDEINNYYETLKTLETDVAKLPDQEKGQQCPTNATGTYPACRCKDAQKSIYNANTNICDACPGDKIAQNGACVCPGGTLPGDNDKCNPSTVVAKCDTSDNNIRVDEKTGDCSCINGYQLTKDTKNCECPSATHEINDQGLCVQKQPKQENPIATVLPTIVNPTPVPEKIVLPAKNLFATGKSELTREAIQTIANFAGRVSATVGDNTAYCISVVGHTDKTGSPQINKKLSQDRANAVKNALTQNGLPNANINAKGVSDTQCEKPGNQSDCRKVEISFSDSACPA